MTLAVAVDDKNGGSERAQFLPLEASAWNKSGTIRTSRIRCRVGTEAQSFRLMAGERDHRAAGGGRSMRCGGTHHIDDKQPRALSHSRPTAAPRPGVGLAGKLTRRIRTAAVAHEDQRLGADRRRIAEALPQSEPGRRGKISNMDSVAEGARPRSPQLTTDKKNRSHPTGRAKGNPAPGAGARPDRRRDGRG